MLIDLAVLLVGRVGLLLSCYWVCDLWPGWMECRVAESGQLFSIKDGEPAAGSGGGADTPAKDSCTDRPGGDVPGLGRVAARVNTVRWSWTKEIQSAGPPCLRGTKGGKVSCWAWWWSC